MIKLNIITYIIVVLMSDINICQTPNSSFIRFVGATKILRENFPELKIRVVNVVDLMKLESNLHHPHGLTNNEYNIITYYRKEVYLGKYNISHVVLCQKLFH